MMDAIECFDYRRRLQFSTYAINRIRLEMRRAPLQNRQLISLSHDHTTAQSRVHRLACESRLPENHPDFFRDVAARYEKEFGPTAKVHINAAQAAELFGAGNLISLSPAPDDEEGKEHDIPAESGPSPLEEEDDDQTIRMALNERSPAMSFALTLLLRCSDPTEALNRFNQEQFEPTRQRLKEIVFRHAAGRGCLQLSPCEVSERVVRAAHEDSQSDAPGIKSAGQLSAA